jgi:hypothetical protein
MLDINPERIARVERRNRLLTASCVAIAAIAVAMPLSVAFGTKASAHDKPEVLRLSELDVVDERNIMRIRIGGQLPDAVVGGKVLPRGQRAAGILLYDETGQERSGYNLSLTQPPRFRPFDPNTQFDLRSGSMSASD